MKSTPKNNNNNECKILKTNNKKRPQIYIYILKVNDTKQALKYYIAYYFHNIGFLNYII